MNQQDLLVKQEGKVLHVTLNRPDALNAFSRDMIEGLTEAMETAKNDSEIRAVLLSGAGRSFSAGGDVKQMGEGTPVMTYEHIGRLNQLILAMSELDVPIVAAVHGYAAGAGVCLALACDMVLAAEDSKFIMSFAKVGLISDGGGLFFLPRTIGLYRAKEALFLAEPIDAVTAHQWGMVNRLYPADQLFEEAGRYAAKLAEGPSRAIGQIKRIANQSLVSDLSDILEMERITQAMIRTTDDHKEGVCAFVEKRQPNFQGK
ncbi:enoyl-CoA hydratase/isomerase family protein [Effusibacillus lacus]|uniref:Enoyl-CoA hydratase n=1 Tax=Effusibacillus lacus TaxID=1348429 RepID=A0A292YMW0_9BACL|nr:enoyl-CoA hydratase [Effusibacillus lacus]TCS72274.1 2-(1,2-epoxy-1,2-dihydrophenyl)acetyl-CoA isomerase [Effusibacillus lacus]GAX90251.1 enoyl-CoA hydratase [Effusibacillus lacus]